MRRKDGTPGKRRMYVDCTPKFWFTTADAGFSEGSYVQTGGRHETDLCVFVSVRPTHSAGRANGYHVPKYIRIDIYLRKLTAVIAPPTQHYGSRIKHDMVCVLDVRGTASALHLRYSTLLLLRRGEEEGVFEWWGACRSLRWGGGSPGASTVCFSRAGRPPKVIASTKKEKTEQNTTPPRRAALRTHMYMPRSDVKTPPCVEQYITYIRVMNRVAAAGSRRKATTWRTRSLAESTVFSVPPPTKPSRRTRPPRTRPTRPPSRPGTR